MLPERAARNVAVRARSHSLRAVRRAPLWPPDSAAVVGLLRTAACSSNATRRVPPSAQRMPGGRPRVSRPNRPLRRGGVSNGTGPCCSVVSIGNPGPHGSCRA